SMQRWTEEYFSREGNETGSLVFYLNGPRGIGKKHTAKTFCSLQKMPLLFADTKAILAGRSPEEVESILERLFRETIFYPAVIYLENADVLLADGASENHSRKVMTHLVKMYRVIVILAGETTWNPTARFNNHTFMEISFPVPLTHSRKESWTQALNDGYPLDDRVSLDTLAGTYRFTFGQIRAAAAQAAVLALKRSRGNETSETDESIRIQMTDLYTACRSQADTRLREMARKVTPIYKWQDIVLPPDKLNMLKEMCNHVKHRHKVYGQWGFGKKLSLGKGLNILLAGPSGTGKTMASEILANVLNLDFYKIDLSCVVSKYIGETEKNL
ncbi:MAG: ATP-binding protein, partial [bacterium]|nr:ATP-binding protein [bacterium]